MKFSLLSLPRVSLSCSARTPIATARARPLPFTLICRQQECQNAYQFLLDPERRAKYDKTLLPRANSQVLSYLNARSAARHGVPVSRVPSRATYNERPEHLYSTLRDLLDQVQSCARQPRFNRCCRDRQGVP